MYREIIGGNNKEAALAAIVKVTHKGKERLVDSLLDTGSNGTFISKEYAEKIGLEPLEGLDNTRIVNTGGGAFIGRAGIIDSIVIGEMEFENEELVIVKGENLKMLPAFNPEFPIVVGLPHITKSGVLKS